MPAMSAPTASSLFLSLPPLSPRSTPSPQFLNSLHSLKEAWPRTTVQSVFGVGTLGSIFLEGRKGAPYCEREALPFFSEPQVQELLQHMCAARGVTLEAGIAADIHAQTAGHASQVVACGRALEALEPTSGGDKAITLDAWRDFSARHLLTHMMACEPLDRMAAFVASMPPPMRELLDSAPLFGSDPIWAYGRGVPEAAKALASQGWLVHHGGVATGKFLFTSPLVRHMALVRLGAARAQSVMQLSPHTMDGQLDTHGLIARVLPLISGNTLRRATHMLSKHSASALAASRGQRVPDELAYHLQLYGLLRAWLHAARHTVYSDTGAAATRPPSAHGSPAGMLIAGRGSTDAPKLVVELAASLCADEVQARFQRTLGCMAAHSAPQGVCVAFTAVSSPADVSAVAAAQLAWPTEEQLAAGLTAIHVVHDLGWQAAVVHSRRLGHAEACSTHIRLDDES